MDIVRRGRANWRKTLKDGEGRLTTGSGALSDAPYSFPSRFAEEKGTNPEELIAAAHAGCFSMALAFFLEQSGFPPDDIHTEADLHLDTAGAGPSVSGIHLRVTARVPNIGAAEFEEVAARAKEHCLVSRLLATTITLEALLEGKSEGQGSVRGQAVVS